MEVRRHAVIEKMQIPMDGRCYNVQIYYSVDGGNTFWYCGYGKYCRDREEVAKYIKEYPGGIESTIDNTEDKDGK